VRRDAVPCELRVEQRHVVGELARVRIRVRVKVRVRVS